MISTQHTVQSLEKEINNFWVSMPVQEYEHITEKTFRMIANHFYNLGLKHGQ